MCVFMDMITSGHTRIYPSVTVVMADDTRKTYSFVQYVYVGSGYITITRISPDDTIHEEVRLENVKFFQVVNE